MSDQLLKEFESNDDKYLGKPLYLKDAKVGCEYFIYDSVIGKADEGLVEVLKINEYIVEVFDLLINKVHLLNGKNIVAIQHKYDNVYYDGVDCLV